MNIRYRLLECHSECRSNRNEQACGGHGGGKLHEELLFSPGGRGGVAISNSSQACHVLGLDGQSSRSDFESPPNLSYPFLDHQGQTLALSDNSSRTPCSGKDWLRSTMRKPYGWYCFRKPDFFLTCDPQTMFCVGAVGTALVAHPATGKFRFLSENLFRAAPAGGRAPRGIGGVKRKAGHGGNGQCAAVKTRLATGPDFNSFTVREVTDVIGTEGAPGIRGLASIRPCQA